LEVVAAATGARATGESVMVTSACDRLVSEIDGGPSTDTKVEPLETKPSANARATGI